MLGLLAQPTSYELVGRRFGFSQHQHAPDYVHYGDCILTSIFFTPFPWAPKGLALIWCALAIYLIWIGALPDGYLVNVRGITTPQSYPLQQVGMEIFVTAVIFVALAWSLLEKSWRRISKLLLVIVLAGSVGVLAGLGAMHAPSHFVNFALSMLLVAALAFLLALSLSIIGLIQKWHSKTMRE
jgi:hypothetical protein